MKGKLIMKEPSPLEWVIVVYDDKWHNPCGNDGIIFTGCTSYHYARKKLERLRNKYLKKDLLLFH